MKKFATAAVAATMTLGLIVPTAGAAEEKGSSYDDAYKVTTVVSGNKCTITYAIGLPDTLTPAEARRKMPDATTANSFLMNHQAYLRGDSDQTFYDFMKGEDLLALQACANGENYTTNFVNSLSSVVEPHEGRAAAYWLSVIVPALLGIAALGAAFSPEFRNALPVPVAQFLGNLLK
ncbi:MULTISPECIES: hypothetical protein [unclassified Corynebacterium]|uniref:hypothetical protein n=1 Tax=unclassified Corynebacterium TaxID=2624378 RepID=UPI00254BB378|nr:MULTISPECIES: hypothetical protein [unclassified Corynebacterium]MDK8245070.1 hypothetical protein [Corynebacterium sp. UMB10321]WPJ93781.1 hypothetical protein R0V12_05470 [Corynebacterium sp. UMB2355A]